jgi:hypothetical protein
MKFQAPILTLLLASSLFMPASVYSQSNSDESLYLKVDYFKAEGSDIGEYLFIELELWKNLHKERYARGIIKSWDFYAVFSGEPDKPYNFIAINVFDDFSKIDYFDLESIIGEVYPDMKPNDLMERTRSAREVVRTEIWQVNKRILSEGMCSPGGEYLTINYFDARGGSGEYAEMEIGFWGAIHETRISRDILNSWAMYTLLYPGGDVRNYTYSTIDYYDRIGDLREPVGMPLARMAHPDLNDEELNDLFSRTGESRTLYKTEIWKRLGSVGPDH